MHRPGHNVSKSGDRDQSMSLHRKHSSCGDVSGGNRSILRRSLGVGDREAAGSLTSSKRVSFADDDHLESIHEYPRDRVVVVAADKGSVCCALM